MQQELRHLLSLKPFSQFVIELVDGDRFIIYNATEVGCLGTSACAVLHNDAVMILPYQSIVKVRLRGPDEPSPLSEWMMARRRESEIPPSGSGAKPMERETT